MIGQDERWRLAVASHGKGFGPASSHAGFLFSGAVP